VSSAEYDIDAVWDALSEPRLAPHQDCQAYVCQAGRAFRAVDRIAFYADREVKEHVPKIQHRRDNIEWTPEEQGRLSRSENRNDRKIAHVIGQSRAAGSFREGRYQVFLLTRAGDPSHRVLGSPLPHESTGRGSAFTQRQRYTSLHALETAKTTIDLRSRLLDAGSTVTLDDGVGGTGLSCPIGVAKAG
jgi:hypothetical protein